MTTNTPFADAISGNALTESEQSQVNILRESNYKMKLEIIELKEEMDKLIEHISITTNDLNNIITYHNKR